MPGIAPDGSEDLPWKDDDEPAKPAGGYDILSELYTKAFETLKHLTLSVQQGKITEEQFSTGIDALFMAVSGLVPEYSGRPRFIDVITACSDEAKNRYPIQTRCFYNHQEGIFKTLSWQAGDPFLKVRTVGGPNAGLKRLEADTADKARDMLVMAAAALKHKFVELK